MESAYKPAGYSSVSPYFVVDGAQRLIDLLKQVFDAEELRRFDLPDGTIMHAEVKIDDSVLMMGNSSETYPPNQLLIHIYVKDVDKTFQRALEAGCVSVEAPKERAGDPDRRGTFRDFAGNLWAVSTQMNGEK